MGQIEEQRVRDLYEEFNQRYGSYVCIDEDICRLFVAEHDESLQTVDNLYDWVLSQDMAYEVVE